MWKFVQLFFNDSNELALLERGVRAAESGFGRGGQAFQRVRVVIVRREGGQERRPRRTDLPSSIVIPDGVLQDALKQQGQFRRGFCTIFFRQLEHGILHNIQRVVFVPNGE